MRLLLIEDDPSIGNGLARVLAGEGFSVDWVRDGADAEAAFHDEGYGLVLLDLGLPRIEGLDLLAAARARGSTAPVVVVTARDDVEARVDSLDLGADDYLIKPFDTRELLARIRAVLRRKVGRPDARLIAGAAELDTDARCLSYSGRTAALRAREFALMRTLMERPGRILSRREIEERIYGWGEEVESNAVDVLIHAIRRKVGKDVIRNVRGAGWVVPR